MNNVGDRTSVPHFASRSSLVQPINGSWVSVVAACSCATVREQKAMKAAEMLLNPILSHNTKMRVTR